MGSIWLTSILTECPPPPQKPGSLPGTPRNPLQTLQCGGPGEVPISFPSRHPLRGQQESEEAPSTRQQVGEGAGGVGTDQGPQGLGMEMAGNLSVELRGPQQAPILTAESTSYSHVLSSIADSRSDCSHPPSVPLRNDNTWDRRPCDANTWALKEVTNHREASS